MRGNHGTLETILLGVWRVAATSLTTGSSAQRLAVSANGVVLDTSVMGSPRLVHAALAQKDRPTPHDRFTLRPLSSLRKTVIASGVGPRFSRPSGCFMQHKERQRSRSMSRPS